MIQKRRSLLQRIRPLLALSGGSLRRTDKVGFQWRTHQIISEQWIDDSIAPHIGAADRLYFYGYHWWLGRSLLGRREIAWAAAVGDGGQRLFVVPALELAVVITAGHYADAMQGWVPLVILNRYVLSAVKQHSTDYASGSSVNSSCGWATPRSA